MIQEKSNEEASKGLANYLKNAKQMDFDIVAAFLNAGADPRTQYGDNKCLLTYPDAKNWSQSSYIRLINLCRNTTTCPLDSKDFSLGLAYYLSHARKMNFFIVEAFLNAGADPHTKYRDNKWLLTFPDVNSWSAASYIRLILLCKRAKANKLDDKDFTTGLAYYLRHAKSMNFNILEGFLRAGADPHTRYRGNKWLLTYPDVNLWSISSYTSLITRCKKLKRHKLTDDDFSKGLAHYLTAKKINLDIVALFFAAGAAPDTRNKGGKNLLEIAAANRWERTDYLRLIKMCSDARSLSEKNKKTSLAFFAGYSKPKGELTAKPLITGRTLISLFKPSANNSSEISESEPLIIEY